MRGIKARVWAVVLTLVGMAGIAWADEDAREVDPLKKRYLKHAANGDFEAAAKTVEHLVEFLEKRRGKDHWETKDARALADDLRFAAKAGEAERNAFALSHILETTADDWEARGDAARAEPLRQRILQATVDVFGEQHRLTAAVYGCLAINQQDQRKYADAESSFSKSLAICHKLYGDDHPWTANALIGLARARNQQGKYARAEEDLTRTLAIHRKFFGENCLKTANVYRHLAFSQFSQEKYDEAEANGIKALAVARKEFGEDHPETVSVYSNLAVNQVAQGKLAEAQAGLTRILAIRRKMLGEEHPDTAASHAHLGDNLHLRGRYEEAEMRMHKALSILREDPGEHRARIGAIFNNLSANQQAQARYADADESLSQALAVSRDEKGEEHPYTILASHNLACNRYEQERYAEAEAGFSQVLTLHRERSGEQDVKTAEAYRYLSLNHYRQGKYRQAEEGLGKGLAVFRKLYGETHPFTANSHRNLALFQEMQGEYTKAEAGITKALTIQREVLGETHPDTARTLRSLAGNRYEQGKYAEAETMLKKAVASFDATRLRLASARTAETLPYPAVAARIAETSPYPALAAVLFRNGKSAEAWACFEQSLERGPFDGLSARLRREPGDLARQSALTERIETIQKRIDAAVPGKDKPVDQEARFMDLLAKQREAQADLAKLSRELERKYGFGDGEEFTIADIQAALPTDTALVGWLDLTPHSSKAATPDGDHLAFVLRAKGEPVVVRLTGVDAKLPDELRAALRSPTGEVKPLADRLRKQRLDPLGKHLVGVKRLVVLPSEALTGIPVESIADDFTVSYAASGSQYARLRKRERPTSAGLLAVADPTYEAPEYAFDLPEHILARKLDALPASRTEAEAIGRLFDKSTLLAGSDASEQRLLTLAHNGDLAKFRYLHFATHARAEARHFLQSGVFLARDTLPDPQKQLDEGKPVFDAKLTASEMLRLWHLDADLVTLSACQGDGVFGFAQALILAGSRSVVVSLWDADDTATALLMQRFYANLLGKAAMSKADALHEAKQWLRTLPRAEVPKLSPKLAIPDGETPFAHPHHWAAFILVGDDR